MKYSINPQMVYCVNQFSITITSAESLNVYEITYPDAAVLDSFLQGYSKQKTITLLENVMLVNKSKANELYEKAILNFVCHQIVIPRRFE
jgi:hypothetical protein